MIRLSIIIAIFGIFFLQSCKTDNKPPKDYDQVTETIQPLQVEMDSFIKRGGGPCTADTNCMVVRAVWPVIKGGNPGIRDSINLAIYLAVIANLEYDPEASSPNIEAAADSLIDMYRLAYEELDHFETGYSMDVEGNLTFLDSTAVLELNNYYYMGGAHGNYGTLYYNFNTNNGQVIEYENFVRDSTLFKTITEQQLSTYLESSALYQEHDVRLSDLFWGDEFFLPANFRLAKDSIEFIYNPYEAAPYVLGQIEFKVPYQAYRESISIKF